MSREKLPQLIVDIADRLKDELGAPPLKSEGPIWAAMERLKASELDRDRRVNDEA